MFFYYLEVRTCLLTKWRLIFVIEVPQWSNLTCMHIITDQQHLNSMRKLQFVFMQTLVLILLVFFFFSNGNFKLNFDYYLFIFQSSLDICTKRRATVFQIQFLCCGGGWNGLMVWGEREWEWDWISIQFNINGNLHKSCSLVGFLPVSSAC